MAMQSNNPMFRFSPQLVLGLIIVTVGVLFTLDNLELLDARDYLRYWPVLLILFGISKMLYARGGGRLFGFLVTLGGTLLLLDKMYYIDFSWSAFWPIIFIVIGASMLWNTLTRRQKQSFAHDSFSGNSSVVNHFVVMGGLELTNNSQEFRGGELSAVMGGIEIDLREATIPDGDAIIEVFVLWGGISMKLPKDWAVSVETTPIMAGAEDKTVPPKGESKKRLFIKGTLVMGGLELSN
jgi:predicted membrane protein